MATIITLAVIILYFVFLHQKVLSHLGLTQRDNQLMLIGFFINSLVGIVGAIVMGVLKGATLSALAVSLLFGAFCCFIIYYNYRSL